MDFPLRSVFLALPLEQKSKQLFQALQEELKPFDNCLQLQNPQTPHLTLMYWQDAREPEYEDIRHQAESIAAAHTCFTLGVTGVDTFGSCDEDHVLYLSVGYSEALARVKKSCPWSDDRPFVPHVTLAYITHPQTFSIVKTKVFTALSDAQFLIEFDRLRLYAHIGGVQQAPLEDFLL